MPINKKKEGKENKNRKEKIEDKDSMVSKVSFKAKMAEMLELPKEIVLDVPKITMIGNTYMVVENYKGIMEYEDNRIKLNTGKGIISIEGKKLEIKEITSEEVYVHGYITIIQFVFS